MHVLSRVRCRVDNKPFRYPLKLTDLGNSSRGEVWVVNQGLDLLDHIIWDIVLVKLEQTLQEFSRVAQQGFTRVPVVIDSLSWLVAGDLLWFDLLHDTHGLHHHLDPDWRSGHGPDLYHVILVQGLQAGHSFFLFTVK